MTQTLHKREDPLNLGAGGAASAPLRTWSSYPRRRRGAPLYKRRPHYGPQAEYEPQRKQPRQQQGPGPWYHPPPRPYRAMYANPGHPEGPWYPPPAGFCNVPCRVQMIRVYGLHPLCFCCCSCWRGAWHPGWARPYGRKKRWGRRGRGLRRPPRRAFPRSPPVDLRMLLRPVNLYGWRAPGMRAPRNTTQFIMNQIYEDMRQQEERERQQAALRAQQVQAAPQAPPLAAPGGEAPPSGCAEDEEGLQEIVYSVVASSPASPGENQCPTPPQGEDQEEECEEEVCAEKESEEEEEEEDLEEDNEEESEEEVEGADYEEEGEEEEEEEDGKEEVDGQREEENHLPLEMPLSILVGSEEERENFLNCHYFSPKQTNPQVPPETETLFMQQDMNC
ncbi:coiled-coil domain-containing glutamate-rich protein 1 isoform X2 [Tenrec ecaudatus]|uniref:coiled-coil domain-containing glutamate-rich protein 1 isoform X2 n=1 Tax=Tenrec ecaudatus TaxID=94439 RepID=UPI003F59AE26